MKRPSPKYQIFISSTYEDLHEAREEVTRVVLKLHGIPVGMEAFTATDDRGWKTILPLIDVTDYYVLILAGRYGSIDLESGKSWTQLEYEHAVKQKIPVLGFIRHQDEIKKIHMDHGEDAIVKQENLQSFIKHVRDNHQTATWRNKEDLAREVSAALSNHIRIDENSDSPRPGWYRGDQTNWLNESPLHKEIEKLQRDLQEARKQLEQKFRPYLQGASISSGGTADAGGPGRVTWDFNLINLGEYAFEWRSGKCEWFLTDRFREWIAQNIPTAKLPDGAIYPEEKMLESHYLQQKGENQKQGASAYATRVQEFLRTIGFPENMMLYWYRCIQPKITVTVEEAGGEAQKTISRVLPSAPRGPSEPF